MNLGMKSSQAVAGYVRVSMRDQHAETQIAVLKDYSLRHDIQNLRFYSDVGVSGAKDSRPQLDQMLHDIRSGRIDTVLVFKIDRLGRSLKNLLDLLAEFKNRSIRLISISDGLDTANSNAMNRAFWQMLAVFAELERSVIVDRVTAGLARAKAEGKQLGRPKGSRDKTKRSTSGYHLRYAGKSKKQRKLGKRKPHNGG